MSTKLKMVLAVASVCFLATPAARGDLQTYFVSFSAQDFQYSGPGSVSPPVDPVEGSFTITLDPTLDYESQTAGITLNSLNIVLGSTLSFTYKTTVDGGHSAGTLRVGGLNLGSDIVQFSPSTNDFWLFIKDFTTSASFEQLGYSQTSVSSNNLFYTINQTGSASVSQVPEPSAMLMMATVVPWLMLRRRTANK